MDKFRLLILSSGRAGSTSLLNAFHYSLKNSTRYFEVLDTNAGIITNKNKFENHLIEIQNPKTEYYIEKNLVSSPSFQNLKNRFELWTKYITYFDKIILLVRKNLEETIESFAFAQSTNIWHDRYNFSDHKNISKDIWESESKKVIESNELIISLSKENKIPITYYEDLFFLGKKYQSDFLNSLNLKLDYPNLFYRTINPNQKYRQDGK